MTVGDAIGYSVAAVRHRVHRRKAKRLCSKHPAVACVRGGCVLGNRSEYGRCDDEAVAPRQGGYVLPCDTTIPLQTYEQARRQELTTEATNEPYLLPAIDPEFLDERGYLRPWADTARIVLEVAAYEY